VSLVRKRIRTMVLAAGTTAAVAVAVGVTSAAASTATWTVTPGGSLAGARGTLTLTDTVTGTVLTSCGVQISSGTLESGSGLSNPIGTNVVITFMPSRPCSGPGGQTFRGSSGAAGTVIANTYDASTGQMTGHLKHAIAYDFGNGSTCGFSLVNSSDNGAGTVLIKHLNSNPMKLVVLARGGNLRIFNVFGSPCDSLFNNGDVATLAGRITLSIGQAITSP
jgi:hypothetical protein